MYLHAYITTVIVATIASLIAAIGEEDLVTLPNVTFSYSFKTYSGYLYGDVEKKYKMFYWLTESQGNPETDPLVLWLNGGPGCSSLGGAFEELGPFYMNQGGYSLFENIFAWNKNANVLFLESPAGVGFSYVTTDVNGFDARGDDRTAEVNFNALSDFFSRVQPKYRNRFFFITGESYAGIYLPTLARLIIQSINANNFANPYFQGVAIGNGWMNARLQFNSILIWSSYHGLIGVDEWKAIKNVCCKNNPDVDTCDFYAQLNIELKKTDASNETSTSCGEMVLPYYELRGNYNPYNFYHDCYRTTMLRMAKRFFRKSIRAEMKTQSIPVSYHYDPLTNVIHGDINYDSTDNQNGLPCWAESALFRYLNDRIVMKALHVDDAWINGRKIHWTSCNARLNMEYMVNYLDTTSIFIDIINEVKIPNFRFLIYNGDLDTVCDFLGDAWHISALAQKLGMASTNRVEWTFRDRVAGFVKRYYNSKVTFDVLTVKGAGHFVPIDRQGPALKMITNFLLNSENYSSTNGFNPTPPFHEIQTTPSSPRPASFGYRVQYLLELHLFTISLFIYALF